MPAGKTSPSAITRAMARPSRRRAMWFKSIYLKTLRDFRIAILGWGVGMGLLVYVVLATFPSLVATPQARASLVSLAGSFSWIAEPIAVDTAGGFATFKIGFTILLITLCPLLAGTRILAGEADPVPLDAHSSLPPRPPPLPPATLPALWLPPPP